MSKNQKVEPWVCPTIGNKDPKDVNKLMSQASFAPFLMWSKDGEQDMFKDLGFISELADRTRGAYSSDGGAACPDGDHANLLRDAFYHKANVQFIQDRIIQKVFLESKVRINELKQEHLLPLMDKVFEKYCRFLPFKLKEQVRELDQHVIDFLAPIMVKEVGFQLKAIEDMDRQSRPLLERPQFVARAGERTLPSTMPVGGTDLRLPNPLGFSR